MTRRVAACGVALLIAGSTALAAAAPVQAAGQRPAGLAAPAPVVLPAPVPIGQPAPAGLVPRAPVPIALPHPPPVVNPTSGTLFDALLAIERARAVDPRAAQNASFSYVGAVQEYRSGNFAAARIGALQALSIAGAAQVQAASGPALLTPASGPLVPLQQPGTAGGLYGADAPAIDADSFLALARGTLDDCAARHDARLAAARAKLAQAERDFGSRDWQATRRDAKAAIEACAKG